MLFRRDNPRAPEMSRPAPRCAGVSLIEAVLSMLVVSTMLVAVLEMLGSAATADRVQTAQRIAPALASRLMAEILANSYADTGGAPLFGPEDGEAGSSRANFDDVDDYHGWSSSPVEDKDGASISGLSGWTRAVSVQWVSPSDVGAVVGADAGLKRITVTVTDPRGRATTVTGLRGSSSVYDYNPGDSTEYVNWVGVTLQVGASDQVRMFSGANPVNCVPIAGGD